ncbi:MAG: GH3 auxin-responsive promoter family protein [Lachnospiraceae bacterium]|nr:GH3 auxin-responsive promoter family protein [Lachnospiraceae bacterium]
MAIVRGITNHVFCTVMKKRGANALRHLDEVSRRAVSASEETLLKILKDNADTEYGKKYDFAGISSIDEYRKKVPFSNYDDYAPYIERMINNDEEDLITSYPVRHYALSSGSVGVPKHIPVTQATLDNYAIYGASILFGVMDEYFRNTTGKSYKDGFCLNTIEAPPMVTENGIPKGPISGTCMRVFADHLLSFMTSPAELVFPTESMDSKYLKLRFALANRKVTCMTSAFMTSLVDLMTWLESNWEEMCDDIEKGVIGESVMISPELRRKFESMFEPDPKRADELREEFKKGFDEIVIRIWPDFQWLGAIGTGGFSQYTQKMRKYTGRNVPYSFLNYAASESLMAVARRTGEDGFVLLPDGGFYEFIPADADDDETTLTIDQLEEGKDYEIVVTNLSGFYRYRIKDVVRVKGFYNESPMVSFLYRKNQMISIAGEKTNEEALRWTIERFQDETGLLITDYSVYADTDSKPGRYVLLMEPDKEIDESKLQEYRDVAEKLLGQANPSFGQKIMNGTLGKTKLCITQQETYMLYRDVMIMKGVSQNQLKPVRAIDTPMKEKFFFNLIETETE